MSVKSLIRTSFPQTVVENVGYYVYRLVDPRDKSTFYVGKGTGNRVFQHVAEAADLPDRSSLKLDRIRDIEAGGNHVQYVIHRHGLSDDDAFLVESALIDAYDELTNAQVGHASHIKGLTSVDDLVAQYDKGVAVIDVPAVLLNLNRQYDRVLSPAELYERTRGHWVMNPDRHPSVKYAMAVAYGIIREVYRIESWISQAVTEIVETDLRRADSSETKSTVRCSFVGVVANDIREQFVGKSVPQGAQNPVRWMNC